MYTLSHIIKERMICDSEKRCTISCVNQCGKSCTKCSGFRLLSICPNGDITKFSCVTAFRLTYQLTKLGYSIVEQTKMVKLSGKTYKVVFNSICDECKTDQANWSRYWQGVMYSTTTPSVQDVMRAMGNRRRRRTIERLLAFIECIPMVMRAAMSLALIKLFELSHDWDSYKRKSVVTANNRGSKTYIDMRGEVSYRVYDPLDYVDGEVSYRVYDPPDYVDDDGGEVFYRDYDPPDYDDDEVFIPDGSLGF